MSVRVQVDDDLCQGHNRCWAQAPEVFTINDEAKSEVQLDPVPTELEAVVYDAVANCPERAITVVSV